MRGIALLSLLACGLPVALVAQKRVPPPTDSAASAADSLARPRDSTTTERLLAVEGNVRAQMPTTPRVSYGELGPAGSRIVLTRDSIEWAPARTVSDLLANYAPVFVWRGGWLGRPELPNMLAHGATSVAYVVDGVPFIPIGPDSIAVNPATWALELIDRIEIERAPAALRVYLFTRQHDRVAPRTSIGVSTGDRAHSKYTGTFEKRYASGVGLSIVGDFTGVNAPNGGTGASDVTTAWLQLSWRRNARFGAEVQYLAQAVNRDVLLGAGGTALDTLDPGLTGTRSDVKARVAWRKRDDGLGFRADLIAARTAWRSDSLDATIGQFGVIGGYRRPTWSADVQAIHRTEWTPLDGRLALAWSPSRLFTGAVEGVYQRHSEDRTAQYATARVGVDIGRFPAVPLLGLRLPGHWRIGGTVRHGTVVQAPSIVSDTGQSVTDYELLAAVEGRTLGVEARWSSLDVWQALPYRQFQAIPGFEPQPRTQWAQVGARLAANSWLSLASHYEHPLGGFLPDGVPPNHAWSTLTVNSRFLRNFPSGIFRLKVQGILETWSPGVIGRNAEGEPIAQPGLTFLRTNIQFKIGPFTAYWDRVNFQAVRKGQVPGYPILSLGSSYGIRWSYAN